MMVRRDRLIRTMDDSELEDFCRRWVSGRSGYFEVKRFGQAGDMGRDVEIGRAHSELQSLMRISYAVFCLKKKKHKHYTTHKTRSNTAIEKPDHNATHLEANTNTTQNIHTLLRLTQTLSFNE